MFWTIFFAVSSAICFTQILNAPYYFSKDSTDGDKRSGLVVYTDQATGVQYVSSAFGMAPRIDIDGKPFYKADDDKRK